MPYCYHYLKIRNPEYSFNIVQLLAKEQFFASDAYPLDKPNQYNIDDSMNDVRAIHVETINAIRLFCRYKKDVQRFSLRIVKFPNCRPDLCSVVDEEGHEESESISFKLTWK
jgi:hypothetical protein